MRLVMDTDVLIAAIRSPKGASAALLVLLLQGRATLLLSVALALEYEATATRMQHLIAAKASEADVTNLINAIIDVIEPVEVHYQWRPQLSDAGDEMVLETAVNGRADAIVTFNRRHYGNVPSRFGIDVITPADALGRIKQ
jgi:putative PIN family toxin of toxin-antitoxin system